jgi:hypothetical protein
MPDWLGGSSPLLNYPASPGTRRERSASLRDGLRPLPTEPGRESPVRGSYRGRATPACAVANHDASVESVIVWLNGTHGAGKTTTSALVQQLIPDSRVFDAEKVGETLMDIRPGLPETDNFQHWPPWRPLVVETARRVLDYTGGTLVMPMTVLVEEYWREISAGLAHHAIPVRHFVLHADQETLRRRIAEDTVLGPNSPFRLKYLEPYAEAARTWLRDEAETIDTTHLTPAQAAHEIARAVIGDTAPDLAVLDPEHARNDGDR